MKTVRKTTTRRTRISSRSTDQFAVDHRSRDIHLSDGNVIFGQTNDFRAKRAEHFQRFRFGTTDPAYDIARPGADQRHPKEKKERRLFASALANLIHIAQKDRRVGVRRFRSVGIARTFFIASQQPNIAENRVVGVVTTAERVVVFPFPVDFFTGQEIEGIVDRSKVGLRLLSGNTRGCDGPREERQSRDLKDDDLCFRLHVRRRRCCTQRRRKQQLMLPSNNRWNIWGINEEKNSIAN